MDRYIPLNLPLMSHPLNWVIVTVITLFWLAAMHAIMSNAAQPATDDANA